MSLKKQVWAESLVHFLNNKKTLHFVTLLAFYKLRMIWLERSYRLDIFYTIRAELA